MSRVEGTRMHGGTVREHPEIEINPELALRYLVSLRYAHLHWKGDVPDDVKDYMVKTINEIEQSVEGINRASLEKMLFDHPINYHETISLTGKITDLDLFDFHTMSANWNNPEFRNLRTLMEIEYQVGEVELEFLRAAFEAQPPTPIRFGGAPFFQRFAGVK